jgi:hypothetical protein
MLLEDSTDADAKPGGTSSLWIALEALLQLSRIISKLVGGSFRNGSIMPMEPLLNMGFTPAEQALHEDF